jgi:hypothetical protein
MTEPTALPSYFPLIVVGYVLYVGLCAGRIAQKHGKNPVLYGIMAIISPLNLIILGVWAFGPFENEKLQENE